MNESKPRATHEERENAADKPAVKLENIPESMKARPWWLLWDPKARNHNPKMPVCYDARRRRTIPARWRDLRVWMPFEEAAEIAIDKGLGLHTMINKDGLIALDIDGAKSQGESRIDALGRLYWENHMLEVASYLDSYTERSSSGKGIHLFGWTGLDVTSRKSTPYELYADARCMIVTGDRIKWSPQEALQLEQNKLEHLIESYFKATQGNYQDSGISPLSSGQHMAREGGFTPNPASSAELERAIRRLHPSVQPRFRKLIADQEAWKTDPEFSVKSQSEVDLWVMIKLAQVTQGDADKVDRLFQATGLLREKYFRSAGAISYGERTLNKALWIYRNPTRRKRAS